MTVLYKPLALLAGVAGGILSSWLFHRMWGALVEGDEAPATAEPPMGPD
ncbi:hypothetical protein [Nocardia sp. BMG111209]|nr:hypothetical protein [Nocardia sp. BMG111209]